MAKCVLPSLILSNARYSSSSIRYCSDKKMDGSKKAYAPNKTAFRNREERNISAERLITPPPKYTEHAPLLNKSRSKMDERAKKAGNAPPGAKWVHEDEKDNAKDE